MNLTRDRVHSIGWAFLLAVCFGLTMVLTFRVNAVKSEVRLAERKVVSLKREKLFLETEFETRSSQQQLKALNDLEFGYEAPRAAQYIEGERQLAELGQARGPGAPSPIRVARASEGEAEAPAFLAMVSPLTGQAMAAETRDAHKQADAAGLGQYLARIQKREAARE